MKHGDNALNRAEITIDFWLPECTGLSDVLADVKYTVMLTELELAEEDEGELEPGRARLYGSFCCTPLTLSGRRFERLTGQLDTTNLLLRVPLALQVLQSTPAPPTYLQLRL